MVIANAGRTGDGYVRHSVNGKSDGSLFGAVASALGSHYLVDTSSVDIAESCTGLIGNLIVVQIPFQRDIARCGSGEGGCLVCANLIVARNGDGEVGGLGEGDVLDRGAVVGIGDGYGVLTGSQMGSLCHSVLLVVIVPSVSVGCGTARNADRDCTIGFVIAGDVGAFNSSSQFFRFSDDHCYGSGTLVTVLHNDGVIASSELVFSGVAAIATIVPVVQIGGAETAGSSHFDFTIGLAMAGDINMGVSDFMQLQLFGLGDFNWDGGFATVGVFHIEGVFLGRTVGVSEARFSSCITV